MGGQVAAKQDVYEIVTNQIIDSLEKGVVPWQRPWKMVGGPRNLNSKRPYRGLNAFLLALAPYSSPFWMTYEGAKKAGGNVKKGEKGTLVVFWKIQKFADPDAKSGFKTVPLLRYYKVWNAEQCENVKLPTTEEVEEFDAIEAAQAVIDEMPDAPSIEFGGDRAYYAPMEDHVQLPKPEQFDTSEAFYATAFHELAHATGNEKRLGRIKDWSMFGSDPYAKEELVAEMASAFICGAAGIAPNIDQSAAYLNGWLARLKNDKKLVISAASQAQKAADFVLGNIREETDGESATADSTPTAEAVAA